MTARTDFAEVVAAALAEQSEVDLADIYADQELAAIPGMESVNILRAVVRIEQECDIIIPDDFLFETATVADLTRLVTSLAGVPR